MRLSAPTSILMAALICCLLPASAENEDIQDWKAQVASGKYAKVEGQLESAKREALDKSDYVRVTAIEEIQNSISRAKAAAGGAKLDNSVTLNEAVRMQMLALQSQVERFAKKHNGKYPNVLNEEFKGYFPAISINNSKSTAPFYNPFTKKQEWFSIKQLNNLQEADIDDELPKGKIVYCPIKHGITYAIVAGANDGRLLRRKDGIPLVMTKK